MKRTIREVWTLTLGGFFAAGLVVNHQHFFYNSTASSPIGYYWTTAPRQLERGDFVLVCMSEPLLRFAEQHGFPEDPDEGSPCYHNAKPFLKHVWAVAGDRYAVDARGVAINGHHVSNTALIPKASDGAPIPHATSGIIPDGMVFAGSNLDEHSFDSRYSGPLRPIARAQLLLRDPFVNARTPAAATADPADRPR